MTQKQVKDFRAYMIAQGIQTKRAKAGMAYLVKKKTPQKV